VRFSAKYDVFAPRSRKHSARESPDADFDEAAPASAEAGFAAFTREVELARKAAAATLWTRASSTPTARPT
jgi:hypothetical protein